MNSNRHVLLGVKPVEQTLFQVKTCKVAMLVPGQFDVTTVDLVNLIERTSIFAFEVLNGVLAHLVAVLAICLTLEFSE